MPRECGGVHILSSPQSLQDFSSFLLRAPNFLLHLVHLFKGVLPTKCCLTFNSSKSFFKFLSTNYVSLLVIMALGILYQAVMFVLKNFKIFSTVIFVMASTSIHLVKQSISIIRNLSWHGTWEKGPRISMPHQEKDHNYTKYCNYDRGAL